jgi:hypothetical protein
MLDLSPWIEISSSFVVFVVLLVQILVSKLFDLFRIQFGVGAYWLDQGSGLKRPLVPKRCTTYCFLVIERYYHVYC